MNDELKVLFYLKKNVKTKNVLCPVMGRITIGKSIAQFSCKLDADANLWDSRSGRLSGKSQPAQSVNRKIENLSQLIHRRYRELTTSQKEVSAKDVKEAMQGIATSQETLLDYYAKSNELFLKRTGIDRSINTYMAYADAKKCVQSFIRYKYGLSDFFLKSLTYSFIEEYGTYLRIEKKYKPNTVLNLVVSLRHVVRMAVHKGVINRDPFDGYVAKGSKAKPKSLTQSELEQVMAIKLQTKKQNISRDMFLFAAFTGLAFIDVKNLRQKHLVTMEDKSQWIHTHRQKTGTAFITGAGNQRGRSN
ncbi:integrase-like protein [Dysgonomonas alginatilytica]|uniref:Integrase-like protein n=1 Tax=Dysgonomonas alginatilytica TaxID=1605892 RepID=A0A2V3PJF3_9BACT|nr:site-specific integrase [Dysgonomonas alginatilytica]PXV58405.1 integrase-like protein [Dysgonomonas alginatilytica]